MVGRVVGMVRDRVLIFSVGGTGKFFETTDVST